jgi:antirestriction protein ArdC
MSTNSTSIRADIYTRVTDRILADLEQGVRPWIKPWNAENAAGRITRPLRHNGTPYRGVNVLLLWGGATTRGYASNIWMTYRAQAACSSRPMPASGRLRVAGDRAVARI